MAGVLFIASIPTKEHEKEINPTITQDIVSSNNSEVNSEQSTFKNISEIGHHERVTFLPPGSYKQTSLDNLESNSKKDANLEDVDETLVSFLDSPDEEKDAYMGEKSSKDKLRTLIPPKEKTEESGEKRRSKLEILPDTSMEEIIIQVLNSLKIENYSWVPVKNSKFIYVVFCVEAGPPCEEALRVLTKWGIGIRLKSTLGVIPCTLYYKASDITEAQDDDDEENKKNKENNKSPWNEFVLSVVRSRLAVAQVVEGVKGNAKLTFDFVSLIILAGTIAGVGLIENSTVSIVASMLISPLMGPILAGTFGTVIHDRKLQIMGVRNELVGLFLTILVGFVIGLIIGGVDDYYGTGQWPTQEMMARGQLRSLWVGVLIALPSGAGVALGLLSDNSGSLIGVAISASLLPPAVNAGLLWALAIMDGVWNRESLHHEHEFAGRVYSEHLPSELALLGCVSLSLTLVNIVCIFIAGILVLKIKEVAPRALTDEVEQFWHHDIKVARDYNRSLNREDARLFEKQFGEEMNKEYDNEEAEAGAPLSPTEDFIRRRISSMFHFSPESLRRLSMGPRRLSQTTWSSSYGATEYPRKSSVKDLEKLYASLGGVEPPRLSVGSNWRSNVLNRNMWAGMKQEDGAGGLSPIRESKLNIGNDEYLRRSSFIPRRTSRHHSRFTVTPAAVDPLQDKDHKQKL